MNFLTKLFRKKKEVSFPSVQLSNYIVELHDTDAVISYILVRSVSGNWSMTVDSTTEKYQILHFLFEDDCNENVRRTVECQLTMLYVLGVRYLDPGFHDEVLKSLNKMDKRLAVRLPKYTSEQHDKALKNAKELHDAVNIIRNAE